jgi:hypothetical protein
MATTIIAGSKLEFSIDSGSTYIEIIGIQEMPEFKEESGERETTTVRDTIKKFEPEMDSPTEQALTAFYEKTDADQLNFRTLARAKGSCQIKVTYADGDSLEMPVSLKNYGISSGDAPSTKMWSCVIRRTGPIDFTETTS